MLLKPSSFVSVVWLIDSWVMKQCFLDHVAYVASNGTASVWVIDWKVCGSKGGVPESSLETQSKITKRPDSEIFQRKLEPGTSRILSSRSQRSICQ